MGFKSCIVQHRDQWKLSECSRAPEQILPTLTSVFLPSIIAVHGLNGDRVKTWTTDSDNICWLNHPDLLPKYMKHARVLTWGYNANISSLKGRTTSSERILQHAHSLIAQLHADRDVSSYLSSQNQHSGQTGKCKNAH